MDLTQMSLMYLRFCLLGFGVVGTATYADTCTDLKTFAREGVTIDRTEAVAAGDAAFAKAVGTPNASLPALCRVAATLRPSNDSDIRIEVWLPQQNWNRKLLAVGNGGWSGAISLTAMTPGLQRGYAVTATDTGHRGSSMDGSFAYRHPEKLIDFGWRAVHEMTVTAKAIVDAYYEPTLTRAYWQGCSSGGKQGLKEAQKFPADFDGVIAGAPAVPWTRLSAGSLWAGRATLPVDSPNYLSREKLELLNVAVLKACDSLDRVEDGLIEDPRACTFEPKRLQCAEGQSTACLTAAQVDAANKIYSPLRNPRTNEYLFAGFSKGSELSWGLIAGGPKPLGISNDHFRFVVFDDPAWDFATLDFDRDIARADDIDARGAQLNAASPDIDAFRKRGGKLLMYHGWADGLIPAQNSIDYFEAILTRDDGARSAAARDRLQRDVRLFMVPGMGHCAGGPGADRFDALTALEQWVEQGTPPDALLAEGRNSHGGARSRKLCLYPQVAAYEGSGDVDDSRSYSCR